MPMIDINNENAIALVNQARIFLDFERRKKVPISLDLIGEYTDKAFEVLACYTDGVQKEDVIADLYNICIIY